MSILLRPIITRSCQHALLEVIERGVPCSRGRLGSINRFVRFTTRRRDLASSFGRAVQPLEPPQIDVSKAPSNLIQAEAQSQSGVVFPAPFRALESTYYHQVMESLPAYKETVFSQENLRALICQVPPSISDLTCKEDWSGASNQEIVEAFRVMTSYAVENELKVSNSQFDHIIHAISERKFFFENDEMLEIGKLLTLWPFCESRSEKNYLLLYTSFDEFFVQKCRQKWDGTNLDWVTLLRAADVIFWKRLGTKSHFLRYTVFHSSLKAQEPHHLIQLMFYLGLLRNIPSSYKTYDLERKLYKFRDKITLRELGVGIYALFKVKSRMQYYPLMEDVFVRSLKAFSTIDDALLSTISKASCYSPTELKPLLTLLQRRLLLRFDEFGTVSLVSALWMLTSHCVVEDELIQRLYERVLTENCYRFKELSRLLVVFTNFKSPQRDLKLLGSRMSEDLLLPTHQDFMMKKMYQYGAVIHRLLVCGVFSEKIINDYFSCIEQEKELYLEALGIDDHLEVFYPEYSGKRLKPEIREKIFNYRFANNHRKFVKSCGTEGMRSSFNKKAVLKGKEVLLEILEGREDHVLQRQLIPSFGYIDLLIRVCKEKCYLPIPTIMTKADPWKFLRIPLEYVNDGSKFVAITFMPHSKEISSKKLTCFQDEKVAILERLGFIYIVINIDDWNELSFAAKQSRTLEKISDAICTLRTSDRRS